jgi:hypothetical protein
MNRQAGTGKQGCSKQAGRQAGTSAGERCSPLPCAR